MIEFIDLKSQRIRLQAELDFAIQSVLKHGGFILGPEVKKFEAKASRYLNVKHCVSCANGTDALQLVLMAIGVGPGDAVICPSFTFAATAEAIALCGATPVFSDIEPETFTLDISSVARTVEFAKSSGLKVKAVIAVDLFGCPANYEGLEGLVGNEGIHLIVDGAQSFGALSDGKSSLSRGVASTTSFFPAKPLGCYGDGGAVFTSDDEVAEILKSLRLHGKGKDKYDNVRVGMNSRLDTIQAAILLAKMSIYDDEIEARNQLADFYSAALGEIVRVPAIPSGFKSVWAQYTVRLPREVSRDRFQVAMGKASVPTAIYYPNPLHKVSAYLDCPRDPYGLSNSEIASDSVVSLPMHSYVSERARNMVVEAVASSLI